MEDTMQVDDGSAQIEVPTTPQPQDAELPSSADIPQALSPTTSMLVADPSSPARSEFLPPLKASERPKYSSPPPPSSSITPPPSSQPPKRQSQDSLLERDTTPTPTILSSPPPTIQGIKQEPIPAKPFSMPTSEQILEASPDDLREKLQAAVLEVSRLEADVREARMSAAHYKLQHNLLTIETEEAAKRMEVEHDMTRREVEVLQMAELARRDLDSPSSSSSGRYIAELKAYCESLESDNFVYARRLQRAKQIIAQKDEEVTNALEDNHRLRVRIKENRDHLNLMKSPGGIFAMNTPKVSQAGFPVTPQQYRGTPKQTPRSVHQEHDGSQDSFAALLLADRVLNQENANSAPSTPTTSRPSHRNHLRHSRNVQSLSSLPSTPIRSRQQDENGNLLPSIQFQVPQSEPHYRDREAYKYTERKERSRKSRDSTISASDAEEIRAYNESMEEDDVEESQASQKATAMLRRDPRESHEVVRTPTPTTAAEKSGLLQAKIFGSVTKNGAEKRKYAEDSIEYDAKKARTGEGIGLGIDSWA